MEFEELTEVAVYKTDGWIIITGTPEEDDESHNCDAMGCGSVDHVLYRLPIGR